MLFDYDALMKKRSKREREREDDELTRVEKRGKNFNKPVIYST